MIKEINYEKLFKNFYESNIISNDIMALTNYMGLSRWNKKFKPGDDKWIIYQETNGWDNFLNGIEYMLIPFYNAASPCIIILFQRIINFLYKKLRIKELLHIKW